MYPSPRYNQVEIKFTTEFAKSKKLCLVLVETYDYLGDYVVSRKACVLSIDPDSLWVVTSSRGETDILVAQIVKSFGEIGITTKIGLKSPVPSRPFDPSTVRHISVLDVNLHERKLLQILRQACIKCVYEIEVWCDKSNLPKTGTISISAVKPVQKKWFETLLN